MQTLAGLIVAPSFLIGYFIWCYTREELTKFKPRNTMLLILFAPFLGVLCSLALKWLPEFLLVAFGIGLLIGLFLDFKKSALAAITFLLAYAIFLF